MFIGVHDNFYNIPQKYENTHFLVSIISTNHIMFLIKMMVFVEYVELST